MNTTTNTTTVSEMRLRDYGYNTKKNDVLRERAIDSACREKGERWVNTQLQNMLKIARESESIVLFKDKCNFIGSSPEEEIKKIMDEYERILYNMVVHTKIYDVVHTEFLNNAVINVGWRNVCKELENLKNNKQGVKVAEKIKKDMDYVIEVHSHRKEEGDEDESEEDGKSEDISLRDYGYAVHKTQGGRIAALRRAVAAKGMDLVCARLEQLGKYHPVMLEDLKSLKPYGAVEPCCECVSAEEIRTIVREELSKMFGDIKKMNEDLQKMCSEMIV